MNVDPTDSFSVKGSSINQMQRFRMTGNLQSWQSRQQVQDFGPISQVAAGKFADDEWMSCHFSGVQQILQK